MESNTKTPQNETLDRVALLPEHTINDTERNNGESNLSGNVPEAGPISDFAPVIATSETTPPAYVPPTTPPPTTPPTMPPTTLPPKGPDPSVLPSPSGY